MRQYFIGLFFIFVPPLVAAEWQILSNGGSQDFEQYIDLENVKQTGPMAIHRQVYVLSQGHAVEANGILSTLALHEYDCMNTKFRVLRTSGFRKQWAEGQSMTLSESNGSAEWLSLSVQALEKKTFDLLCPDGKDN